MVILAGSLYLISTAVFSVFSIVVGIRLIVLSRRTQQVPERSLGLGLIGVAGLGYGILIFAMVGKRAAGGADAPEFYTWLIGLGWVFHNLGVVFLLDFVQKVFRPEESWAQSLKYVLIIVLWGGWIADVFDGGLTAGRPGVYYWISFAVIGTYPLWTTIEAFRYWGQMRKRVLLGLADPLVANRFLLWTIASIFSLASIWTVQIPAFLGYERMSAAAEQISSITLLCTAAFGIATICAYALAFFPPQWYKNRFSAASAGATEASS